MEVELLPRNTIVDMKDGPVVPSLIGRQRGRRVGEDGPRAGTESR